MGKIQGWVLPRWAEQLAVVAVYVALYAMIRPLSDAHWALGAGLRLSFLLLLPYRYWLALAVADTATMVPLVLRCGPQFGLAWSLTILPPLTGFAMPVVWACKEKLSLFPTKRLVNFQTLILCAFSCAAVWSLYNFGTLVVIPNRGYDLTPLLLSSFFVGTYVAVLTIVPWVIMVKLSYRQGLLSSSLRGFLKSSLAFDAGLVLIPSLLILSWLTAHTTGENKPIWALFMFAPVAWLTLKHGWRASVLGGTLTVASISLLFTWTGNTPDSEVVQVQAIIAFAITCLIAMGARISAMNEADAQEKANARQAMRLAKQSVAVSELRLRQASETLEQVCGEMQLSQNRLLNRFRMMLPVNESQLYTKQAVSAQEKVYQLADAMHPIAWRRSGLPAALRENIGRALDELGIAYSSRIKGRGLSGVGASLHTTIYRLACESVVYIGGNLRCSRIQLLLRGAEIDGQRIIVLRVEGFVEDGATVSAFNLEGQQKQLASKLGATGLDLHAMRDSVRLFNGELHVKPMNQQIRITALLVDAEKEREHKAPSPLRLWAG
ncbi:hypothetical protein EKH79_12605 [Dyella dinghuensis]|uniref:MASE1 domain-containing protein n=1 Tax=Dyella dinghuensis TaxID=1920169 RepID=A0A3S0QWM8_9GAMM|nr:MASE1 domain-containing protein [Dyella dinghuensis]RUL63237.1 hypothetical protein EKH79_12605 [Dyella dinghuensis]